MEWLYGASETSNMEVDIGYVPQVNTQIYSAARPYPEPHLPTSAEVSQGPSLRHPSPLTSGPDGAGGRGPLGALCDPG